MSTSALNIVILAAGQGSRMKSQLPKVLHPLGGQPLLGHVINTARALQPARIIVIYGHGGEQVPQVMAADDLTWVRQEQQNGTGHAVAQAMPELNDDSTVLVLYGDVPLTRQDTLTRLSLDGQNALGLLTVHLDDPKGYGRIVRDSQGQVVRIVEEKDATDEIRKITEVNTGILAVNAGRLRQWLGNLNNNNAQGEYYLTDIIAMAVADGLNIITSHPDNEEEVLGINSRNQLAFLERYYQQQQAQTLMAAGVTVIDPARLDIRGEVSIAQDVILDINVVLVGKVKIGEGVYVGPGCVIKDSVIEAGTQIQPMSVIEQAHIGEDAKIGPFARIRPGTVLAASTHIGNFVEVKNSQIDEGSKVNHLSYIGDSTIGKRVNIGAGTITCNYDGAHKHRTIIGDDVFIGSDTQLVAPVEVGAGATVGAGTTVTVDVPASELTISRVKQKNIPGWKRPTKEK
ncbi:MAG: bifunctional UDP-N-acetylglucosamine diphosphorylase/glucosamine-1-phosphate N-acetyltransferase GlmU [Gammaproteobacteria bacterium]|nr:bifunctional UDP-N-acetylglucosamine diphosphorylase/glucosamine-1-phosphate N-acetyltransferase GlmU [Gammaproteobacteria bacterium]